MEQGVGNSENLMELVRTTQTAEVGSGLVLVYLTKGMLSCTQIGEIKPGDI